MKRIAALLSIGVIGVLLYVQLHQKTDSDSSGEAVKAVAHGNEFNQDIEQQPVASNMTGNPATTDKNARLETSLSTAFSQSRDLVAFVDEMKVLADTGDAEASRYIYRALEECALFTINPDTHYEFMRQQAESFQPEASRQRALALIDRAEERCISFSQRAPILPEERMDWLKRAALQGDQVAQLILAKYALMDLQSDVRMDDLTVQKMVKDTLKSGDPEAIFELSNLMGLVADGHPLLSGPYTGTPMHSYLWALAACDQGYPCGQSNIYLKSSCQNYGQCQYISLEQFFVDQAFAPAQIPRIQRLRNEINAMFETGDFKGIFSDG
ncbi:MAG: hypothetical protein Tsb002_07340 [Wenzhouxiangellaceae bacterium]